MLPIVNKTIRGQKSQKLTNERELPKRAASTPLEGGPSVNYPTLDLSEVGKKYSCENCQGRHEPPLCGCPNCGRPHLVSKCPFSGTLEGETISELNYQEPWKKCTFCQLCHQGTCPCAKYGELAHIATDCLVASMEEWSSRMTTKMSKRDQVSPERKRLQTTDKNQMCCGKCGESHPQNVPCKYQDISKSLWCSTCGGRQNDHTVGCPAGRGTSVISICQKCGKEGHTQENCISRTPCYKCGEVGHTAEECAQMGRFALRHQIYDPPLQGLGPFCQICKKEGHWGKDCKRMNMVGEKRTVLNKYQESYEDL